MAYWLMKSEPEEFSIDDLAKVEREPWTGVRNYQARNFMWKEMQPGDGVLFYHSNCAVPGVVGLASVVGEPAPDPTQFDPDSDYFDPKSDPDAPRWWLRHVAFQRKFRRVVSLDQLRGEAEALGDFALLRRGNRLSILPVTDAQWAHILQLAGEH
jgi:predicted RNA-binding protein with PUA-like domain